MLTLTLVTLATPARADAPPVVLPVTEDAVAKEKKKKDKDGDKKKKNDDDDDPSAMKGKILGFTWEPYVQPGGGVQIDASGGTAITAGADVGIRYWKKKVQGDLYAGGSYLTAENLAGYEVHFGDQTGYRAKYWGAAGGIQASYDGQTNTATGKDILTPAFGVGIPVEVTVGPKKYYAVAGVMPSWYFDESRKPSAGEVPLGDEFEWHVGAGLKLGQFKGVIGFAQRMTTAGVYNTPTVQVGWNP